MEPEFISDSIQGSVTPEDLRTGMRELGVDSRKSTSKDGKFLICKQQFEIFFFVLVIKPF